MITDYDECATDNGGVPVLTCLVVLCALVQMALYYLKEKLTALVVSIAMYL